MKPFPTLEHIIWGDMNLCSWVTAIHIWLRDKLSLISLEVRAVLCLWEAQGQERKRAEIGAGVRKGLREEVMVPML